VGRCGCACVRAELYKNESFLTIFLTISRLCGSQSPTEVNHGAYESPDCPLQLSVSKDMYTYLIRYENTTFTRQNLTVLWSSVTVSE
jgi:hypothetical protein